MDAVVEVGQVYLHTKGDRLVVRLVDGDDVFLQDIVSRCERKTTKTALAKHYQLTE